MTQQYRFRIHQRQSSPKWFMKFLSNIADKENRYFHLYRNGIMDLRDRGRIDRLIFSTYGLAFNHKQSWNFWQHNEASGVKLAVARKRESFVRHINGEAFKLRTRLKGDRIPMKLFITSCKSLDFSAKHTMNQKGNPRRVSHKNGSFLIALKNDLQKCSIAN